MPSISSDQATAASRKHEQRWMCAVCTCNVGFDGRWSAGAGKIQSRLHSRLPPYIIDVSLFGNEYAICTGRIYVGTIHVAPGIPQLSIWLLEGVSGHVNHSLIQHPIYANTRIIYLYTFTYLRTLFSCRIYANTHIISLYFKNSKSAYLRIYTYMSNLA
jgi:hypothetical protein